MLAFKHARLLKAGQKMLADRALHVSRSKGDGLGYDVRVCQMRFDASCKERFIEVTTASFGKETPFFISRNKVEYSRANDAYFHLYRLFEFRKSPRLFDLAGTGGAQLPAQSGFLCRAVFVRGESG